MIILQDLIFSINAVAPVFLIILIGAVLKRMKFIGSEFLGVGTKFVFYIALPATLFLNVFESGFQALLDVRFVILCVSLTLLSFFGIWFITGLFIKDKSVVGAFVNGAFRGNMAFLGLPLLTNMAGAAGAERAVVIITFVVPLYNICTVILLAGNAKDGQSVSVWASVLAIVKNPLIIAIVLGVLASISGIGLPMIAAQTLGHLAATATPLALICLGGGMIFALDRKFMYGAIGAFVKTGVLPVVFAIAGIAFGFRGVDLMAILVVGGVPSAIAGYAMAVHMGADAQTAAGVVFLSTAFSAFFLTFYIFLLRSGGFF